MVQTIYFFYSTFYFDAMIFENVITKCYRVNLSDESNHGLYVCEERVAECQWLQKRISLCCYVWNVRRGGVLVVVVVDIRTTDKRLEIAIDTSKSCHTATCSFIISLLAGLPIIPAIHPAGKTQDLIGRTNCSLKKLVLGRQITKNIQ